MTDTILFKKDYLEFRQWLNLNLDGLTWQGRFRKEFESFWDFFFEDNLSISHLMVRFEYAITEVRVGSLSSWFKWLRDKFINFVFIFRNKSTKELAVETKLSASLIATILRGFLLDEFPHCDHYLSEVFQVGNLLSPHLNLTFGQIKKDLQVTSPEQGSREDEIMPSMEVTLFDEWGIFIRRMKSDFSSASFDLSKIKERATFLKQVKVIQDTAILLLIFSLLIIGIRQGNIWYEKFLLSKVSIYEPQFSWLNKKGIFKGVEKKPTREFKLDFDGIKDISKSTEVNEFFDPEKYEEESETTLTNFENIPRNFSEADKEASQYEGDAEGPNGYRETKGGTTKIYRLMMTTSNVYGTRDQINEVVKKYQALPVGESKPGNDVPGGVYYNIHVPRSEFKNFMSETMKIEESKLFESNTSNVKNVPGKIRVFIMVKSI